MPVSVKFTKNKIIKGLAQVYFPSLQALFPDLSSLLFFAPDLDLLRAVDPVFELGHFDR